MSTAIAKLEHIRGETITFGLRSLDPAYDGSETVTCDVKVAVNGAEVPAENVDPTLSITPVFADPAWMFTITAAQSAALGPGNYITDAKVAYANGSVDYPKPLLIVLGGRVTA
jgi:hypothetical protein